MGKKNNAHGNFLLQAQPRWKKNNNNANYNIEYEFV